ncbi:hypothetical protein ONZ51_g709 [Trametes cubensis]|uniref:Uncharacterized protein n=1 Tax=Trametes cubensis TaxID=1111947 RepID=A0AAD7U5A8_9APHY|nr:hypothetical protein ONZ51_g709 [Trametes cubensis]
MTPDHHLTASPTTSLSTARYCVRNSVLLRSSASPGISSVHLTPSCFKRNPFAPAPEVTSTNTFPASSSAYSNSADPGLAGALDNPSLPCSGSAGGVGGGVGRTCQYAASTLRVHSLSPHFGPTGAAGNGSSTPSAAGALSTRTPLSAQLRGKPSASVSVV